MVDRRGRKLADAVWKGDRAKVEKLLAEGLSPQSSNNVGSALFRRGTPLYLAAREGHLAVVVLLLQAGADPNLLESGDKDRARGRGRRARRLHERHSVSGAPATDRK